MSCGSEFQMWGPKQEKDEVCSTMVESQMTDIKQK